ncbi:MAG: N-methyl-L-tryptophan oxidase [Candidatus Dormibacteraeota bacterium]|nr:N-methyl-L-tryptophan oxidase [Candidatus Dormibacteraeota bacterium]
MDAEVIVVGLGSMGSQALWRLARRGVRAIGFDRFDPPHILGSHHGGSRIIRTAYYEAPEYVPLARASFEIWRELEVESATQLLTMTRGLNMGRPDSPEFAGALLSVKQHGLEHEILDAAAMRRRFPQHLLADGELALLEVSAGYVLPEKCIAAALRCAGGLGADVHINTPVTAVESTDGGVTVHADGLRWSARRAIVAAGPWNSSLTIPGWEVPLRVVRQSQAWFRALAPEMHHPSVAPVFVRNIGHGEQPGADFAYGFPSIDAATVKVGVAADLGAVDPDTADRTPSVADSTAVSGFVERTMPSLDPRPVRVAICLQEFSPDHQFIVGPLPSAPAIIALMGFSGHGFKFASAIGEAAAAFAVEGATDLPISHLAASRFAGVQA